MVLDGGGVFDDLAENLGHPPGDGEEVTAAVLGRPGPAAAGAARVGPATRGRRDLLDADVMAPQVGEVVVVDEAFALPEAQATRCARSGQSPPPRPAEA